MEECKLSMILSSGDLVLAFSNKIKLIEINVTEITRLIFFRMISLIKLILDYVKNNCGLPRVFLPTQLLTYFAL